MTPREYKTLVFDCDGVILDSNRIKTEAFRLAAAPYGDAAADALVAYHVANGGISRYRKFEHFLEAILPAHLIAETEPQGVKPGLEDLLDAYAAEVHLGLRQCAVADGLGALRAETPNTLWLVASGGDQTELREVFAERGIADWFDGGIFGSPASKHDIVASALAEGTIVPPALLLGDSRIDHEVAMAHGLDFVFVSGWTEMPGWRDYVSSHDISVIPNVSQLTLRGSRSQREIQ